MPICRAIQKEMMVEDQLLLQAEKITKEFPGPCGNGDEPYYPVNDSHNNIVYREYRKLADATPNLIVGGRLGSHRYQDMHVVIRTAIDRARQELSAPVASMVTGR